jgi:hypothetical protein
MRVEGYWNKSRSSNNARLQTPSLKKMLCTAITLHVNSVRPQEVGGTNYGAFVSSI